MSSTNDEEDIDLKLLETPNCYWTPEMLSTSNGHSISATSNGTSTSDTHDDNSSENVNGSISGSKRKRDSEEEEMIESADELQSSQEETREPTYYEALDRLRKKQKTLHIKGLKDSTSLGKSLPNGSGNQTLDDDIEDDEMSKKIQTVRRDVEDLLEDPKHLCCPILYTLFKDPVVAEDGFTYEHHFVERFLRDHKRSPVTGEAINSYTNLIKNLSKKSEVCSFKQETVAKCIKISRSYISEGKELMEQGKSLQSLYVFFNLIQKLLQRASDLSTENEETYELWFELLELMSCCQKQKSNLNYKNRDEQNQSTSHQQDIALGHAKENVMNKYIDVLFEKKKYREAIEKLESLLSDIVHFKMEEGSDVDMSNDSDTKENINGNSTTSRVVSSTSTTTKNHCYFGNDGFIKKKIGDNIQKLKLLLKLYLLLNQEDDAFKILEMIGCYYERQGSYSLLSSILNEQSDLISLVSSNPKKIERIAYFYGVSGHASKEDELLKQAATKYAEQNNFELAEGIYNSLIDRDSSGLDIRVSLAETQIQKGNIEGALGTIVKALKETNNIIQRQQSCMQDLYLNNLKQVHLPKLQSTLPCSTYERIQRDFIENKSSSLYYSSMDEVSLIPFTELLKYNTHVTSLNFCNSQSFTEDGLKALCDSLKKNNTLRHLFLNESNIKSTAIEELSSLLKVNTSIRTLDLSQNPGILDRGVQILSQSLEKNNSLTSLRLRGCKFTHNGMKYLADVLSNHKSLKEVDISENELGSEGAKHIGRMLSSSQCLQKLKISGCNLIENSLVHVFDGLICGKSNLTEISLRDNSMSTESAKKLGQLLEGEHCKTLKKLSVRSLGMTDECIEIIANSMKNNRHVKNLKLRQNAKDRLENSAKALSEMLKFNNTLESLNLSDCHLRDEDVKTICVGLKENKMLKKMILEMDAAKSEGYGLTDVSCTAFADVLVSNQILEELNLRYNSITDVGAQELANVLKTSNRSLKCLDLGSNKISDEGLKAFAECMKVNQVVQLISLTSNPNITISGHHVAEEITNTLDRELEVDFYSDGEGSDSSRTPPAFEIYSLSDNE